MNNLRFLSSYTAGTIYEQIVRELLIPSLEQWKLPYHIAVAPDLGTWAANSRQRPFYIKQAMLRYPGENILWVDADAKILKYPSILFQIPEACDLGVNYLLWDQHYGNVANKDRCEILDGTSYYKNSPKMLAFIDEWIERSIVVEQNHRKVLNEMILEKIDSDLNLFIIPREYCYIMTKPDGTLPAQPLQNPVITHYQASRVARHDLYGNKGKENGFYGVRSDFKE